MLLAGNVFTTTTHIITVVVGAGVLALAWAMAQLGWIPGLITMIVFACISIYTYNLIADCYRYPDPINGKRNYTYMQAVHAYLGIIYILYTHLPKFKTLSKCSNFRISTS